MYKTFNEYYQFTKEMMKIERNKGIEARINPKAKKTKKKTKKRKK